MYCLNGNWGIWSTCIVWVLYMVQRCIYMYLFTHSSCVDGVWVAICIYMVVVCTPAWVSWFFFRYRKRILPSTQRNNNTELHQKAISIHSYLHFVCKCICSGVLFLVLYIVHVFRCLQHQMQMLMKKACMASPTSSWLGSSHVYMHLFTHMLSFINSLTTAHFSSSCYSQFWIVGKAQWPQCQEEEMRYRAGTLSTQLLQDHITHCLNSKNSGISL